MNIQIKLNNGHGRLLNKSPFLLADNETLDLTFDAGIAMPDTIITARNGNKTVKHRVAHLNAKGWTVPPELYAVGSIEIAVEVLVNSIGARKYVIEPIEVAATEDGLLGYPVLQQLYDSVAELTARLAKAEETLTAYDKRLVELDDYVKRIENF